MIAALRGWWRESQRRYLLRKNLRNAPGTLEEAVERVTHPAHARDYREWKKMPERVAVASSHAGLGRWMQNNWGLWDPGSRLSKHFAEQHGITHPDDMSSLILTCVHRTLNGREWGLGALLKRYRSRQDERR